MQYEIAMGLRIGLVGLHGYQLRRERSINTYATAFSPIVISNG